MNNYYCVTIYDNKDENYHESYEYPTKMSAMHHALDFESYKIPNQYIEVWEKDEDGLYGNYGSPIYKSDFTNLPKKARIIFPKYPELDKMVEEITNYTGFFIDYMSRRASFEVKKEMPYIKQYILEEIIKDLEEWV